MKNLPSLLLSSLLLLSLFFYSSHAQQVYIVYIGDHIGTKTDIEIEEEHYNFLQSVKSSEEEVRSSLLYSYKNSINGFAAVLSADEAAKLSETEGVISAFPSKANVWSPHTTRSWEFVESEEGLSEPQRKGLLHRAKYGKDIIVGLLDSGIWPESKSFHDKGMGAVPSRWRGICQGGDAFNSSHCNRKLIGARYYIKGYENYYGKLNTTTDYRSPRDNDGHGSHTSSTVGGRRVRGASAIGGFAYGTASSGAPKVRLAMYKVCWPIPGEEPANGNTCFEEDMLAAIDDALADGVDVLSISIGTTGTPPGFMQEGIAIGALHAVKKNVVVACSAGNSGPAPATASNLAPWIITVGASTVDRLFPSPVQLGSGIKIQGQTVTSYKLKDEFYPLVFAGDVEVHGTPKNVSGQCLPDSLSPNKIKGKIVMCLRGNGTRVGKGMEVKNAGGAGFILGNSLKNGAEISVDPHVLPATAVIYEDATTILNYIKTTKNPTAKIVPATTVIHTKPAPFMAAFSSTGPNVLEPNILKPDITAPGVNILAAWSESSSPTKLTADHRRVKYNLLSGTSMSCPHVAAAAALLKAIHPSWSSAAIRSALMTTATITNNVGKPITDAYGNAAGPFNYGSGHLMPAHAADPGLIYDTSYDDYVRFLCSSKGVGPNISFTCSGAPIKPSNLNHPSVAISNLKGSVTVKRTVTNVGLGKSVYHVQVDPPPGVDVVVSPRSLSFRHMGQKKSFYLTFKAEESNLGRRAESGEYLFGWYIWTDGVHVVRSPMAVSLS